MATIQRLNTTYTKDNHNPVQMDVDKLFLYKTLKKKHSTGSLRSQLSSSDDLQGLSAASLKRRKSAQLELKMRELTAHVRLLWMMTCEIIIPPMVSYRIISYRSLSLSLSLPLHLFFLSLLLHLPRLPILRTTQHTPDRMEREHIMRTIVPMMLTMPTLPVDYQVSCHRGFSNQEATPTLTNHLYIYVHHWKYTFHSISYISFHRMKEEIILPLASYAKEKQQ